MSETARTELASEYAIGRPCAECPWRRDVPAGKFPPSRFEELRPTCDPGGIRGVFGCHMTPDGREKACAGMLRVVGWNVNRVRQLVLQGRIPTAACEHQPGDPPLFSSYDEMAEANGCEE